MFVRSISTVAILLACYATGCYCFAPSPRCSSAARNLELSSERNDDINYVDENNHNVVISRKNLLEKITTTTIGTILASTQPAYAKCTDIESCREEGERKVEEDLKRNPIIKLSDGVRYRVLNPPSSPNSDKVKEGSNIDLVYSISTASGQYMYSKGFGFEKVEFGGRQESDLGLDSMLVRVGQHNVPVGIEYALIGMGKGERRRVELPPGVGFDTSDWNPEPTTRRGKTQIELYKRKLAGFASQPAFPAETVWDIEVLSVRN